MNLLLNSKYAALLGQLALQERVWIPCSPMVTGSEGSRSSKTGRLGRRLSVQWASQSPL